MPDSTVSTTIKMTTDECLAANLAALGVKSAPKTKNEKLEEIFTAAVTLARETGELASSVGIGHTVGASQSNVHQMLCDLERAGRMIRVGSGSSMRFVPKVV